MNRIRYFISIQDMGFNEKTVIYELLDLDLREVKVVWYEATETQHIITVKGKKKSCVCPICHKPTTSRQDLREQTLKNHFHHMYFSNWTTVVLRLVKRYFKCNKCKTSFMEQFYFEPKNGEHTTIFEQYVMYARWHMSGNQIARNTWCSPQKIHSILNKIDPDTITKQWIKMMEWLEQIYLGIDEHSFRWRDMVMIITELKERKVLAILEGTTNEILTWWLKALPQAIKNKIVWLSIDMSRWYKWAVESVIPNVITTVDKYHLVQEANRMVDEVRKLNTWLIKAGYVKESDLIKYKKIPAHAIKEKKE